MGSKNRVKYVLNKNILPLPLEFRKSVKLIIGEIYYVSFNGSTAFQCELMDIIGLDDLILIGLNKEEIKIIKSYEIGSTPLQAVYHQLTYDYSTL